MSQQGYDYAAFVRSDTTFTTTLCVDFKPRDAVFFSKIIPEDEDAIATVHHMPDWFYFCMYEMPERLDDLKFKHVAFIKSGQLNNVLTQEDVERMHPPSRINWPLLAASGYNGIKVDRPHLNNLWRFGAWDVDCIAIWNVDAFIKEEIVFFRNTGEFTYTDYSMPVPDHMTAGVPDLIYSDFNDSADRRYTRSLHSQLSKLQNILSRLK